MLYFDLLKLVAFTNATTARFSQAHLQTKAAAILDYKRVVAV